MLTVNKKDIDQITEVFYRLLKGETPPPVQLPENFPDNEIRQMTEYINRFLEEYHKSAALIYNLSKGELDFDVPRGKILFLHSLKSLQSNLRHLTWKTQMIAKGDFSHEVDFMGDFSAAFNSMVRKLKESFDSLKQREAETRELMADIQAARLEAEAAAQIKSQFLANMSHEIRTPMNSVLGFIKLALEDDMSGHQRENLNIAYHSAKSLLRLINDILDVSKLENGRMELEKRPFDLCSTVQESLRIFEIAAREKGVSITFRAQPDIPPYFIGDPDRLRQIIVNLAGNALKFTEKGAVAVAVNLADGPSPEGFNTLHFEISDTGIGIPEDRIRSIFDPFTQADNSTARRFGGTGLGTTISKRLVELMGGQIWVESQVGRGSVFHFTVLLKRTEQKQESPDDACSESPCHRRFRILLAEDIQENIMLATIRLEQKGHTVITARNGAEAVEKFRQDDRIDLILMDVHMPEMDGLEATRKIRETDSRNVTVIALTASLLKEDRDACRKAGMDAVVGKPVDFDELFAVMEKLVPEERGQPGDIRDAGNQEKSLTVSFPEIDGADIRKGLAVWQNADSYRNALICFAEDYRNVPARLKELIGQGDAEGARRIAHALKGVSGNLSVTDVYAAAKKINDAVRENRMTDACSLISDLENALGAFAASVRQLETNPADGSSENNKPEMSDSALEKLFQDISDAYKEYDPGAVDPFLKKLDHCLSPDRTAPIKKRLSRFDFDGAKEETVKLAQALGLNADRIIWD